MVIGYKIDSYDLAERIVKDFNKDGRWLKSVVTRVTGDGDFADRLPYSGLLHQGYRIRGVAQKILRIRGQKIKRESAGESILEKTAGQQLSLFS